MSYGSSSVKSSLAAGGEDEFWEACLEAEKRHRHEMRNWQMSETERTDRSYLWSIRKVRLPLPLRTERRAETNVLIAHYERQAVNHSSIVVSVCFW